MPAQNQEAQSETVALFVSDVHLHESLPRTTKAFLDFLSRPAKAAPRLYLLGDLFEYWAGDDDLEAPYHSSIARALRDVNEAGVAVFWVAGNRDFLVGREFAVKAGVTLLDDPHVEEIGGTRTVLAHGDAQCTDDHAYMTFRAQVRQPEWQAQFLAQPLSKRKALIEGMRTGSREAQKAKSYEIMDVNPAAITALFESTGASVMIHGHTHRPATHIAEDDGKIFVRHVLPDWDCDSGKPRGGWLALQANGGVKRYDVDGAEISAPILRN
ncbi:UDP-2,3-diacylglucosamine diphosphatase [Noviherbaspirillum denitrificans]|uniref:UDP-2,3-diacylglucosamine hydrolase n=1 Tax=Noviherbaspirillum denitrificans TaxID=1968433 RepID=A0A254TEA8_9BURK|nr:UDP-2,3-diacylglucosamine diphosphatase [Noviherbaspirillum denitrificans]OWW20865.1 UDP-2,3-diacylglucosamine hydrolase [Noviherbaspirillum denitrificans]